MLINGDQYVRLKDASALIKARKTEAATGTIRKAIVGLARAGEIVAYSERLTETVHRLDRPELPVLRQSDEFDAAIPSDFWRYSLAVDDSADISFETGNFRSEIERTWDQLAYRFRRSNYGETPGERCLITQIALGVRLPADRLLPFFEDRNWKKWGGQPEVTQKRGRIPEWKWDAVKAALTIEAANNPVFLTEGVGQIVEFMIAEFRNLHFDQHPELTDLYAYARLICIEPREVDSAPTS